MNRGAFRSFVALAVVLLASLAFILTVLAWRTNAPFTQGGPGAETGCDRTYELLVHEPDSADWGGEQPLDPAWEQGCRENRAEMVRLLGWGLLGMSLSAVALVALVLTNQAEVPSRREAAQS